MRRCYYTQNMRALILLSALASLFMILRASALEWNSRNIEIYADGSSVNVRTNFSFLNLSEQPIRIIEIVPECGCTIVELEDRLIDPGERGELWIELRTSTGPIYDSKKVSVRTDDEHDPLATLRIDIHRPEQVRITPSSIVWNGNNPRRQRNLNVEVWTNSPINIVRLDYDRDLYLVETVTSTNHSKQQYVFRISPRKVRKGASFLTIRTDYPPERPNSYNIVLYQR